MLDLNPETVCRLIDLAREFQVKEEAEFPDESSPADDWDLQVLEDHEGDPSYEEFQSIVSDLEPDQQHQLIALMWLGRGDYGKSEWPMAIEAARVSSTENSANYLIAHPHLADHLTEGLY